MAAVAAQYEGQVTFLGVPGLGSETDMRDFVSDTGTAEFTHAVDENGALWQRFGVVAQPAFAFVDTDGSVRVFGGSLDEAQLRRAADELLAS